MRILLFVEPYPVRGTLVHFRKIAKDFISLLSPPSRFDIRMFANAATLNEHKIALAPHAKKLLSTTRHEEDYFDDCLKVPWASEGLPLWLDLINGTGEVTERQLEMLRRLWHDFPFEIIVHWGENGAITRFVQEHPVTRVAMELGCTRPPFFDSLTLDPFGTNGSAALPKLTVDEINAIVDGQKMDQHEALFGFSKDISAPGYALQFEPLSNELDAIWMNRKTAFLPLQLFDDANLIKFSPYSSLVEVVLDVVPKLADAGYQTVIKPHPASKYREGSLNENAFARRALAPWSDSVIWCNEETPVANARLFTLSDLVVTVNSSVGFEALYYDKPVVVLGDAVYKPKDMFPSLQEVLSDSFDYSTYLDHAGVLRRYMLGGYLQSENLMRDPSAFCNRLGLIHHIVQDKPSDPRQFARDFWRACAPEQTALARSAMFWGISLPGIHEFAVPAAAEAPASDQGQRKGDLPRTAPSPAVTRIIKRLVRLWQVAKTNQWIAEMWATDTGKAEIAKIGGITAPAIPKCWAEASARWSPRNVPSPPADDIVLAELKSASDRWIDPDPNSADAAAQHDNTQTHFMAAYRKLAAHVSTELGDSFQDWLISCWNNATKRGQLITFSGIVDVDYYLAKYPDIRQAGVDPAGHYSNIGMAERRCPRDGVEPHDPDGVLALLLEAASVVNEVGDLREHPLSAGIAPKRAGKLQRIRAGLAQSRNRIAAVVHLYYTDLVPDILDRLGTLTEPFDLIVTMPDWGNRGTVKLVKAAYPQALFYAAPNRGRDIGPFLDILPTLIDKNYDAVLKLQTKRGYFRSGRSIPEFGHMWREETFDALLGSRDRVTTILDAFRTQPKLNMVAPDPFIMGLDRYPYHDGGVLADRLIADARSETGRFVAGTMFWVRPACLQPLARLNLTHFAPETGANDGELAHLVERMFGDAGCAAGGLLASAPVGVQEPLDPEGKPITCTLDTYFRERAIERRKEAHKKNQGALIW